MPIVFRKKTILTTKKEGTEWGYRLCTQLSRRITDP
jgi:hypothetical protein